METIKSDNLKERIAQLEREIENIKKRNEKVEADKAWEVSDFRKVYVAISTYIIVVAIMYFLNFENIFINALIPVSGYLLSTLSWTIFKEIFVRRFKKV